MKTQAKFIVQNSYDGSEIALAYELPNLDWDGPFDTMKEARDHALAYHRATKDHALYNIDKIKKMKVSELEVKI